MAVFLLPLSLFFANAKYTVAIFYFYLLLIVFHEIGHAVVAKFLGLNVLELRIGIIHGSCTCNGFNSENDRRKYFMAWGGVLFQFILFVLSSILMAVGLNKANWLLFAFCWFMVTVNVKLIILNLLPVWKFDGVLAWKVFNKPGKKRKKKNPFKVVK
ncbi:probable zinc metallopeptidase [Hahella chejuensis KCTC 2396]|uniref:Probable zinc metallopeptidase n=1 Tax=Hahella chejuensis (strain KCTC 2396) TaxID=349521 RepID=Q2SGA2_HAHCH|nr:M50 family metallopeptidase [Hahella chejuensis]ABC30322.1 probable zinc metallopeptidase [Hahella chejuensis KCTC 2396]